MGVQSTPTKHPILSALTNRHSIVLLHLKRLFSILTSMKLHIDNTSLTIHLDWQERLWAFHLGPTIEIPVAHICQVSTAKPTMEWYTLRAPGTALPGLFVAGTYYTKRGREFWYMTRNPQFLVLDLTDHYYKRIVLTMEGNEQYAAQISEHSSMAG